jgi:hypothetical protein
MAEPKRRKPRAAQAERRSPAVDADDAERALGRAVALGLPGLSLIAAIVVGVAATLGSALLVLASGTLLGAIALLWASIRTLSGDAPLSAGLAAAAARDDATEGLAEEKRRILRALKDLESEHALGRIDDADYDLFVARYRDEAKSVMREMDQQMTPMREEAERVARQYLEKHGIVGAEAAPTSAPEPARSQSSRLSCSACGTSNETDAAFCKKCGAAMASSEAR